MSLQIKTAKKIFTGSNIKSIDSAGSVYIKKYKIAVFVPIKNVNAIASALAEAGAGVIGNYTHCSFRIAGKGTFKGNQLSNPSEGKKEEFETVDEIRLEMLCDKQLLDSAIDKMLDAHPYEEPAYEIYEVMVREKKTLDNVIKVKLKRKITVKSIIKKLNESIDTASLPKKMMNVKIKHAVIDYSGSDSSYGTDFKNRTLYIRKNKNITNIELI
jgi:hypothetical protein